MAKHLNVNLQFTADTSQAASQIKNLQSMLAGLTNGSAIGKDLPITKELTEAQQAAGRLKAVLQDSLNPKGTVDIGRFTQNFKKAGLDLTKLKGQMDSLGPAGSKAFAQLAQSIATADAPLRKTNRLVSELSTTLKNTARWQLTSSMIHGFVGGLQEAYSYVQALDKSLTNIRIVSGASAEEMARFAEQANKSAQALSTTTTKYTDAALIYYQQGLNDKEVKERTDTTIKMANVTGEGVADVSSYMTAIWNNFNKAGDESAEHYADIMTKLGAATAASTDEIAAGLSKFSAVADTIGLSFDMASSSVTAIVDQTRESPEVVGTALKTIFSRVEGLKQGETLEDGVDLNKYSQGLKTVGVDIMDASGQLKDMDTILHEIGDRWATLDKNSQVALAQTVAGVRQYNQFIALFDNWDKVEENLDMAASAGGTLQEQADVYAESWEAARNRVTAAAQAIYADLLDDGFFKGLLNTFAKVLQGVDSIIDSMGGLGGVVAALGAIFTRIFEKQMLAGISNAAYNLRQLTKTGRAENEKMRQQAFDSWRQSGALSDTKEGKFQANAINAQATLQEKLYAVAKGLDEETLQRLQHEISINQQLQEQVVLLGKQADLLDNQMAQTGTKTVRKAIATKAEGLSDNEIRSSYASVATSAQKNAAGIFNSLTGITSSNNADDKRAALKSVEKRMKNQGNTESAKQIEELRKSQNFAKMSSEELDAAIMKVVQSEKMMAAASEDSAKEFDDLRAKTNLTTDDIYEMTDAQSKSAQGHAIAEQKSKQVQSATAKLGVTIDGAKAAFSRYGTAMVSGMQAASSLAMGISSLVSVVQVLNNEDMSFGEKFLSITMSLGMAIPMITMGIQGLKETVDAYKASKLAANAADNVGLIMSTKTIVLKGAETLATKLSNTVKKEGVATTGALTVAQIMENAATEAGTIAKLKYVAAALLAKAASMGFLAVLGLILAAITAVIAVVWLLVKAFQAIKAQSPEAKLEAAKQKSEELGTALENAKTHADNLRTAIQNFDNASDALEGCIKGTEEYRKALMDSNQAALELLELYPELRSMEGAVTIGEDGRIMIDEDKLAEAQKNADKNVVSAQMAKNQADQETREAENVVNKKELAGSMTEDVSKISSTDKAYAEAQIQNNTDTIANWTGTPEELAKEIFGSSDDTYVAVAQNLIDNQDKFFQYANGAIQEGVDNLTTQGLVGDYLRADEKTAYYANDADLVAAASRQYDVIYEDKYAEQQGNDLTNTEATNYLAAQGITDYTDLEVNDDEITYKVGEEDFTVSKDTIDSFTASGLAMEQVTKNMGNLDMMLTSLTSTGNAADKAIAGAFINGDLTGNSFYQNEKLMEETGYSEDNTDAQNKAGIEAYLKEKDITAENTENYDEIVQAILDGFALNAEQKQDTKDNLQSTTEDLGLTGFNNSAINKMGVDTGADVQAATQEIYANYGREQAEAYIQRINEAGSQQEIEEITESQVGDKAEFDSDIQQHELDAEDVETYKDELIRTNEAYSDNIKLAEEAAVSHKRMQKGVQTLTDNWDEWNETMSSDDPLIYSQNFDEIKDAVGDMLDLSEEGMESMDPEFLKENWDLVKEAINGNTDAMEELTDKATIDLAVDASGLEATDPLIEDFQNDLAAVDMQDIQVGATLDSMPFYDSLVDMVTQSTMSVDEINGILENLGFDPVVEEVPVQVKSAVKNKGTDTYTIEYVDPETGDTGTKTITAEQYNDMGTDGMVTIPKINGAKSKYTGKSSGYRGASRSRPSGGGGRGRGGGRARERRRIGKKNKNDEIERYHVINNKLEDMEHQLSKIEKAKDRAFGKNKLKLMDQEIAKLEDNLALQKDYQKQVEDNLQKDKEKLKSVVKDELKLNVKFDENGTITNYEQVMNKALSNFEKKRKDYNKLSANDQEALDNKYKKMTNPETGENYSGYEDYLEAEYEKVKDAIDQYEETQDLAKDVEEQIQDSLNEIYDLKLEKVDYKVQLKLEVNEDDKKIIDFLMDRIDGDAWRTGEQIALHDRNIVNSQENITTAKSGLEGIFANHENIDSAAVMEALNNGDYKSAMSLLGDEAFTEAEVEKIKEYSDTILDETANIKDEQMAVVDSMNDVFDAHMEHFEQFGDSISHASDMLSAYGEVIDLVGQEELGISAATMQKMRDTSIELLESANANAKNKFDQAKAEYDYAEDQLKAARETGDKELIKHWEDVVQHTKEGMQDAESEWMSSWTELLQAARDKFDDEMQESIRNFEKAVAGAAGSLEGLSDQMDLHAMVDDNYLEDYERIYELNKLNREIENSIDNTSNVRAKEALLELEDKITQAKESGRDMSEHEVEALRKQYELKLAEIALEEAQNSKSQVRMTKDAEGNFSYVYTADDSAVEDAEQNYEDKLREYQELNHNYIKDLESQLVETQQNYAQAMAAAAEMYGYGTDEYTQAVALIQQKYTEEMGFLHSELQMTMDDNQRLHTEDVISYAQNVGDTQMLNMEYIGSFDQTTYSLATGYASRTAAEQAWQTASAAVMSAAEASMQAYQNTVKTAMEANTGATSSFGEAVSSSITSIADVSSTLASNVSSTLQDVTSHWGETSSAVSSFAEMYNNTLSTLVESNEKFVETVGKVTSAWAEVQEESTSTTTRASTPTTRGSSGGNNNNNTRPTGSRLVGRKVKLKSNARLATSSDRRARLNTPYRGRNVYVQRYIRGRTSPYHVGISTNFNNSGSWVGWLDIKQIEGYRTGGYTGKWNNRDGKLAMLHQKEIVLNAGDTENFLKAVDIVRQISQTIDLNALSSAGGLSRGLHSAHVGNKKDTLQQQVHITAEFPNATDKNEIIKAFDNVINLAAQYANKKR